MFEIDPYLWWTVREVSPAPSHFFKIHEPITKDSEEWVRKNAIGRYAYWTPVFNDSNKFFSILNTVNKYISFENKEDAILYQLSCL